MKEQVQEIYNAKVEQAVSCFKVGKVLSASHLYGEIRGITGTAKTVGLELDHTAYETNNEIFLEIHKQISTE